MIKAIPVSWKEAEHALVEGCVNCRPRPDPNLSLFLLVLRRRTSGFKGEEKSYPTIINTKRVAEVGCEDHKTSKGHYDRYWFIVEGSQYDTIWASRNILDDLMECQ